MSIERYEPASLLDRRTDSWTAVVEDVAQLASQIAGTDFVPEPLRGKPAAVAACILRGRELGLPPMLALSTTHVIKGRVGISAEMMRALIVAAGHDLDIREMKSTRCVIAGRRAGRQEWTPVEWTIDKARYAGLGGGDGWKKYPWAMLLARASAELARAVFPDVVAGLAALEELEDTTPNGVAAAEPARSIRRAAAPHQTSPPAGPPRPGPAGPEEPRPRTGGAPPLPGEDGYEQLDATTPGEYVQYDDVKDDPVEPEPEQDRTRDTSTWDMSEPQRKAMGAAFNDFGLTDHDLALAITTRIVGREIGTRNDLTRGEYRALMDTLGRIRSSGDLTAAVARIVADPNPLNALNALFPDPDQPPLFSEADDPPGPDQ